MNGHGIHRVDCPVCDGIGEISFGLTIPSGYREQCKSCKGWGEFVRVLTPDFKVCPQCNGTALKQRPPLNAWQPCPNCNHDHPGLETVQE